jgi:two-component system chemotaxis response regulator CheY
VAIDPRSTRTNIEPGVTRRPLRLLIVDDDVVQQELLKRAAGRSKFEVTLAGSCGEAIGYLEADGFACVVLDLELADGDGVEVCSAMVRTG